ncbi:GNAT family N-acetyltransferase [Winogradskyella psychrotolerans]|uniref:GNAT family N-acetyltransferase n=1 Tax=Winogradskyella psychrotolerans TaxID=1344585 RepID=UPI001C0764C5|nr:GNAT family N-acetyltransferase [Winogradskyella psychrotolerans]MBU2928111.1 GNAT family N-acetyltransferase [Winogradskyella psychrotolerans]
MEQPRLARIEDMPRVLELIQELATYEKEADAVEITVSDLETDGFGSNPKFTCFVCEVENVVEGIALVYPRYSTWKGEILHLEDLIVSENYRGKGVGTLLLDTVVKHGQQLGVKRISWEVLDWNEPAIKFYESKGADVKRDWDVVHLDEQGIQNYLNQL